MSRAEPAPRRLAFSRCACVDHLSLGGRRDGELNPPVGLEWPGQCTNTDRGSNRTTRWVLVDDDLRQCRQLLDCIAYTRVRA